MATSETPPQGQVEFSASSLSEIDLSKLEGIGDAPRSNGSELGLDEIFELLKNARRREVVRYLLQHDGSAKLSELAEHIAAAENNISVHELSSDQRKRVYIGLYQCHLPKMDNLGVIEYDKNRGSIELQDSVGQLLPYMEFPTVERQTDQRFIPMTAFAVAAAVTIGAIGLGPLSAIPIVVWTGVSVIALLVIGALQYDMDDALPLHWLTNRSRNE